MAPIAVAAVGLTMLVTPVAFGQEISDALRVTRRGLAYNAHALGMGNTYSTIGYDVTALFFNPATMAVNKTFSWTVSANTNAFRTSSDYYDNVTDLKTSSIACGQLGLTVPFRLDSTRSMVVGLSYAQSKDFSGGFKSQGVNLGGRFPSFIQVLADRGDATARALGLSYSLVDGSGNIVGDHSILSDSLYERSYLLGEGNLAHYALGVALEPVHNVFFGASATYNTGRYTSDLELYVADVNDVIPVGVQTDPNNPATDGFVDASYRAVQGKQYEGWDARFGVLYKFFDLLGVSASFKMPAPQKVTEEAFVGGRSEFAGNQSIVVPETYTSSSYKFQAPTEVTVGAMANLWLVTGTLEANYVDYDAITVTSGLGSLPERTAVNKRIKEDLMAVINWNAGAEVRLPLTGLIARAGAVYQPSPYLADPSSRLAHKAVALGAGYNSSDMMQFDVAYAYGWRGENKNPQTDDATTSEQKSGDHTVMFTMRVAF